MKLARINAHPRDSKISFYDYYEGKEHVYLIEGVDKQPTSTTTLIHKYFPKFDADAVINKYYANWQAKKDPRYYGMSKEEIKEKWAKNGKEASELGSKMHLAIEEFFNDELKEQPDTPEFKFFLSWWTYFQVNYPDWKPYRTEWLVYNQAGTISGSIDMIMSNSKGQLMLIDWKRSKEIRAKSFNGKTGFGPMSCLEDCNYAHYSVQLNVYKYLLEQYYQKEVVGMYLAVFHPNQEHFLFYPIPNLQTQVESLIKTLES
jgi:ATP-dependent exoDNAse (exonuclease V) beta subunit